MSCNETNKECKNIKLSNCNLPNEKGDGVFHPETNLKQVKLECCSELTLYDWLGGNTYNSLSEWMENNYHNSGHEHELTFSEQDHVLTLKAIKDGQVIELDSVVIPASASCDCWPTITLDSDCVLHLFKNDTETSSIDLSNIIGTKGDDGADGQDGVGFAGVTETHTTVGLVTTYTITPYMTDGSSSAPFTIEVTNGADGDTISVSPDLTQGIKIGSISVNGGTPDDLYAPMYTGRYGIDISQATSGNNEHFYVDGVLYTAGNGISIENDPENPRTKIVSSLGSVDSFRDIPYYRKENNGVVETKILAGTMSNSLIYSVTGNLKAGYTDITLGTKEVTYVPIFMFAAREYNGDDSLSGYDNIEISFRIRNFWDDRQLTEFNKSWYGEYNLLFTKKHMPGGNKLICTAFHSDDTTRFDFDDIVIAGEKQRYVVWRKMRNGFEQFSHCFELLYLRAGVANMVINGEDTGLLDPSSVALYTTETISYPEGRRDASMQIVDTQNMTQLVFNGTKTLYNYEQPGGQRQAFQISESDYNALTYKFTPVMASAFGASQIPYIGGSGISIANYVVSHTNILSGAGEFEGVSMKGTAGSQYLEVGRFEYDINGHLIPYTGTKSRFEGNKGIVFEGASSVDGQGNVFFSGTFGHKNNWTYPASKDPVCSESSLLGINMTSNLAYDNTNKKLTFDVVKFGWDSYGHVVEAVVGQDNINLGISNGTITIGTNSITPITSISAIDGNPTLAWGTRSVVGTVNGTDFHVTMPSQPSFTQVNADWNASSGAAQILNKPTIPAAANNATITIATDNIASSSDSFGDFTVDASTAKTINIPKMKGADGTNAGLAGLVPKPSATDNTKFLKGDGSWSIVNPSAAALITNGLSVNYFVINQNGGVQNVGAGAYVPILDAIGINRGKITVVFEISGREDEIHYYGKYLLESGTGGNDPRLICLEFYSTSLNLQFDSMVFVNRGGSTSSTTSSTFQLSVYKKNYSTSNDYFTVTILEKNDSGYTNFHFYYTNASSDPNTTYKLTTGDTRIKPSGSTIDGLSINSPNNGTYWNDKVVKFWQNGAVKGTVNLFSNQDQAVYLDGGSTPTLYNLTLQPGAFGSSTIIYDPDNAANIVNIPTTAAHIMGSSSIGSSSQFIYWNGSAFVAQSLPSIPSVYNGEVKIIVDDNRSSANTNVVGTFTLNDSQASIELKIPIFTGINGLGLNTLPGLVPKPNANTDTGKYLKSDGTWDTPGGGTSYTAGSGININSSTTPNTIGHSNTGILSSALANGFKALPDQIQFVKNTDPAKGPYWKYLLFEQYAVEFDDNGHVTTSSTKQTDGEIDIWKDLFNDVLEAGDGISITTVTDTTVPNDPVDKIKIECSSSITLTLVDDQQQTHQLYLYGYEIQTP